MVSGIEEHYQYELGSALLGSAIDVVSELYLVCIFVVLFEDERRTKIKITFRYAVPTGKWILQLKNMIGCTGYAFMETLNIKWKVSLCHWLG